MPTKKAVAKPVLKKSIRYIRVRLEIEHPENVTPESVMNEMDYTFKSTTKGSKVVDTNIAEYEEVEE